MIKEIAIKYKWWIAGFLMLNILDGTLTRLLWLAGGREITSPVAAHTFNNVALFWVAKLGISAIFIILAVLLISQNSKLKHLLTVGVSLVAIACIWNIIQCVQTL